MHNETHRVTSSLFFHEVEALIPQHNNHHRRETTVCLSKGSSRWAPSISPAVSSTVLRLAAVLDPMEEFITL